MKRPLVSLAILYALGIFFSAQIRISLFLLCVISAVSLILCLFFSKNTRFFNIFLSVFIFLLGVTGLKNSQTLSQNHISRFFRFKNEPSVIKGYIANQPFSDNHKTSFVLRTEAVKDGDHSYSCEGNILVQLRVAKKLFYGEELILRGRLYRPIGGLSASGRSYRDYLYDRDIRLMMKVKTEADLVRLHKTRGFIFKRLAFWLKAKMEKILIRDTSSLTQGILGAVILGDKKRVPRFVHNIMMKSGTLHILVVSGLHVGIVGFMILFILKLLGLARRSRSCIAILSLVIYCFMTGASTPVVRATIMATLLLLGSMLKREPDIRNSLALAFLFILLINPRQLFDVGFQLSFACVTSLIYFYPKMRVFFRIQQIRFACLRFLLDGALVSLSCWLATMGFVAYYFRMFSPVTVLANLLIVPLAALMTLCGFSLIGIGSFFAGLVPILANTCDFLVAALVRLNTFLVNLPLAFFYLG
ncbi:MAG: ComEC/Rec2 family competence protein [Candidatus Omnitrophota bacterium]